jgi:hypothetical protein
MLLLGARGLSSVGFFRDTYYKYKIWSNKRIYIFKKPGSRFAVVGTQNAEIGWKPAMSTVIEIQTENG